jgi:hypothetical protein
MGQRVEVGDTAYSLIFWERTFQNICVMKTFTVATHSQNMYPYLKNSAKRFGHDFITLGWNQKYKNHLWKDQLMMDACSRLPRDEMVCFVDGFDSIICSTPEDMIKAYREISPNMDDLVMSVEGFPQEMRWARYPLWAYFNFRVFPRIGDGSYINTGMYMAPAAVLVDWLKHVRKKHSYDTKSNQLAWGRCIKSGDGRRPKFDITRNLFYNHIELFSSDSAIVGYPDGTVRKHDGRRVHVVSLPGFRDCNPLLRQIYGNSVQVSSTSNTWNTNRKMGYYVNALRTDIIIVSLFVLVLIVLKTRSKQRALDDRTSER